MSMQFNPVKILEQCRISPPPNSVPTTSIPLTFFDIDFLCVHPPQSLFLYRSASSEFTKVVVPLLKKSLSLALQRFFPLCGNCICPPRPSEEPYILYKDGDSVPLLVAQCPENLNDLLQYGPTDAKLFRLLVPRTLPKRRALNDDIVTSLLSVQVTQFPNSGLCIGVTHHHAAADAMSLIHFVKTWASISKAKCEMSNVSMSLPVHDKRFIKDPHGIKDFRLSQWRALGSPVCNEAAALSEDRVRAIFTMSRFDIDRLKKWITTKCYDGTDTAPKLHLSSFVVTSAFIWTCLIKTLDRMSTDHSLKNEEQELCHFGVVKDCRSNYGTSAFLGNCLIGILVSVARSTFRREECVEIVAEALSDCVQSLKAEEDVGIKLLNEFPKFEEAVAKGENILTVTSTPKQAAYDTDFGWGRPEKIEAVHIDTSGSISLTQSRNEEGGIEVGLCRSRHEMEVFTSIFEAGINQFRNVVSMGFQHLCAL